MILTRQIDRVHHHFDKDRRAGICGGFDVRRFAVLEFRVVFEDRFAVGVDVGEAEELFAPGAMPLRSREIGSGDVDVGLAIEFKAEADAFGLLSAKLLASAAIAVRWGLPLVDPSHLAAT